jgi:phenylalanyl-tRNA synthetase beta chain
MRVPFEWLKEFIDIKEQPHDVAHRLTMIGLEVEAVEHVDGDVVFEINVTPNRPDCLSIIGIARELSAVYREQLKFPEHNIIAEAGELDFNVDILDADLCRRYAGRVVRNVSIGPSPDWLKSRIEKSGIRSINNVVDITNYVLLELGHPLHAFDLKTIKGHRIIVGTPNRIKGQGARVKIKTLDGIERDMPDDSLLIWDEKKPIAIAGVMGGMETEVSDSTKDIFIESAYFEPASVRRTAKALGLTTESSYRFERGTDIKMLKKALDRTAFLMKEVAKGVIYGKIDIYPKRYAPPEIVVKYEKINKTLGLDLKKQEIFDCLSRLALEIEDADDSIKIKPPAYRRDIKQDADVIEEVARIYGYDRIPSELPKATIMSQESEVKSQESKIKNNIKQSLLKSGFTEAINYSFMDIKDIDIFGIKEDDERRKPVQIKNPLKTEESFMRTTLIPALIKNTIYNVAHGNRDLRLFEIARVFIKDSNESIVTSNKSDSSKFKIQNSNQNSSLVTRHSSLPLEREHLGAIYYKEKDKTLYRDDTPDFYVVKGVIEAILNDLKIYDYSFARSSDKSSEPFLHPGQSADIFIMDTKIGYVGALSPAIVDSLDIKAHKPSIIVMEIDIDSIVPYAMQVVKYRPLTRYPYIERDTAILVDEAMEVSEIMKLLKSYSSDLIEDVCIFDVYQGKNIAEGQKSIAFNVRYRALDRTLKDDEIDALHGSLIDYIIEKTKGQLRQ